MEKLAIVQRYPYDSNKNGDASYINSLCAYYRRKGLRISLFVTDIGRGRGKPFYKSSFSKHSKTFVRRGFAIGQLRISYDVKVWVGVIKKFLRVPAEMTASNIRDDIKREADWVIHRLEVENIKRVIFIYDGTEISPFVEGEDLLYANIPVFFRAHKSSLGQKQLSAEERDQLNIEAEHLMQAPFVGFHSNDDVKVAISLGITRATKVGIGVDIRNRCDHERKPSENTILFVAALADQNIAAVDWMLDEIMPLVLSEIPGAVLRIVGGIGEYLVKKDLPRNIVVTGYVDDLEQEYCRATVVVSPLVSGSKGMKVKVAEALAHGCPLVSTTISVDLDEMIWVKDAIRFADEPGEFAALVASILRSKSEQQRLSTAARKAYKHHICCEAAYRSLDIFFGV